MPKVQEDVKEKLLKQKSKQAKYYNQNTKELPPLHTENGLRQEWKTRLIYVPMKSEQKTVDCTEKNRRHLRQSKEPFAQTSETSSVRPLQDNLPNTTSFAAEPIRPQLTDQPVQHNFVGQPKQTESVTVSPRQESSSDTVKPSVVTRSG